LAANQSITGTLTLGNNSKIVTTGFSLTLVSNTTTTGRLAQVPSSAAYVGNITVQRYIPAKRTFRFIGSPVVGATFNDWRNFGSTTPGIGMYVTGNGTGSDAGSNVPTITPYLETVSGIQNIGFNPVTSGMSTPLTNGVGYKVFVRGDRTINLSTNYTPTNTVIQVSGTPAIGNVSPPISFTNYGVLSQDGWNLVSNPYPSQIDWNTGITRNNVDNAIYIFDPISSNTTAIGDYFTYVNGVSAGINSGRSNPSIIASSQAFFVKANAANPTLTFTENSKTGSSNTANFREESIPNLLYVTLNKSNTAISDNTAIRFDNNATYNFDSDYDAYKMKNSSLNISSFDASGTDLAINTFPEYGIEEKQINLNVQSATNGTYSLFINNLNSFENSVDVYLIDNYLQKTTLLSDNQSYTFDITSISGTQGSGRFKLVFKPQLGKVQVFIQPDTLTNSSWSLDNGNPQKSGTVMTNIPIGNHTISFAKVNNWKEPNQIQLNVIKNETKTIVSVYELLKQSNKSTSEFVVIQQNKNVDTVQITSQSTDINKELSLIHKLYPNPISEGQILHLQTPEDESYTIELISSKGQIIGSKSGISDGIIEINEMVNLTKGLYFIQYKSNNQNFVFKVLKQ
ncbi:MAG: T9SS type A sorting domain-containing protein, partial [Bacteroidota bacterium]|nr:T9SS type A sorting domain-containing protein [Bacteroidota bacterium]